MIPRRLWHIRNKWRRHLALAGHPVLKRHIPPTRLLNKRSLRDYLRRYPVTFVKPVFGSFGNHILRIARQGDGYRVHREKRRFPTSRSSIASTVFRHTRSRRYLLQKGISLIRLNGLPVDYRVLLLRPGDRWEVMGIMGKVAAGKRIVTNYQHGGRPIRFKESLRRAGWNEKDILETQAKVRRLSMTAARAFNRRYKHCRRLGIDIAIDQDRRIWFIEVNTNPYYELFRHHENRSLYRQIDGSMRRIRRKQSMT